MSALQPWSMLDAAAPGGGRISRLPVAAVLSLIILCTIACEKNVEPIALSFELVAQDANASQASPRQTTTPSCRVFDEASSWDSYRQQALEHKPTAAIDFTKEIVLAIFMGEKPTGGYGITVTAVELRGQTVIVTLEETQPPANAMLMTVVTNPYAIYRVERPQGSPGSDTISSIEFFAIRNGALEPLTLTRLP